MMDCAFSGGRRGGLRGLTRRRRRRFRGRQTQAAEVLRVAGGVTRATKRFVNSFTMIEAIRTDAVAIEIDGHRIPIFGPEANYWTPYQGYRRFASLDELARAVADITRLPE